MTGNLYTFFYKRFKSGFTLVETLVAISILLLVVVGPLAITMRVAGSVNFASEQVTAHFLAQEGIELAQKARDDLQLLFFEDTSTTTYYPWDRFKNHLPALGSYDQCFGSGGCRLQIQRDGSVAVSSCGSSPAGCKVYVLPPPTTIVTRARFRQSVVSSSTPFTRIIRFSKDASRPDEVEVVSEVSWRTGTFLATQRVQVSTVLFNVYGTP